MLLHQNKNNIAATRDFFYSQQRPSQREFIVFFSFQQFRLSNYNNIDIFCLRIIIYSFQVAVQMLWYAAGIG